MAEIRNAKTRELVAFYNEANPGRHVSRFADRVSAESRCWAIVVSAQIEADAEHFWATELEG